MKKFSAKHLPKGEFAMRSIRLKSKGDLWLGIGSIVVLAILWSQTYKLKGQASMFPRLMIICGAVAALLVIVKAFTTKPVEKTVWAGLSGETYPDRYKGGTFGIHQEVPHIPNYLVPQECGNHAFTHWAQLSCGGETLTLEKLQKPFHFSAIPYTPRQLEEAFHVEELPKATRTVITVCGEMRGVGGIDTWGSDVERAYHVMSDRDLEFAFRIHI